jgi:hypothetical protein
VQVQRAAPEPGPDGNPRVSGGTYNINSISLSGNGFLILHSALVVLNMVGAGTNQVVDLSGGNGTNPGRILGDGQIACAGTGSVTLSGTSDGYGWVYVPSSHVPMSRDSDWYGAIIGKSLADRGRRGRSL